MIREVTGIKVAAAAWLAVCLAWIALLGVEFLLSGSATCELARGSSIYGDATWRWLPPGTTCRWSEVIYGSNVVITREPPMARVGIGLVLLAWGCTIYILGRRSRGVQPPVPPVKASAPR